MDGNVARGENETLLRYRDSKFNSEEVSTEELNDTVVTGDWSKRTLESYFVAVRAWSFSASLTPVLLGATLAWNETGKFNPILFLLAGLVIISVHGAGNLVNTYYDFLRGVDNESSDDKTLVDNILTPEEVVKFGAVLYAVGSAAFLITLITSDARLEHLCLLFFSGLSGSFLYTGSIGLKYYALGDIVILLMFGPVSVLFSYTVQTGFLAWHPLALALPLVMNTEAILHGNNTRDMKTDINYGIMTLAIMLGREWSYVVYCLLLFIPYFIVLTLLINRSVYFLLPLLTITIALRLEKDFRYGNLAKVPQDTAKLNLLFGFLYSIVFCM